MFVGTVADICHHVLIVEVIKDFLCVYIYLFMLIRIMRGMLIY